MFLTYFLRQIFLPQVPVFLRLLSASMLSLSLFTVSHSVYCFESKSITLSPSSCNVAAGNRSLDSREMSALFSVVSTTFPMLVELNFIDQRELMNVLLPRDGLYLITLMSFRCLQKLHPGSLRTLTHCQPNLIGSHVSL